MLQETAGSAPSPASSHCDWGAGSVELRAPLAARISLTLVFFNCADELTKYRPQSSQSLSPHPHPALAIQCGLSVGAAAAAS